VQGSRTWQERRVFQYASVCHFRSNAGSWHFSFIFSQFFQTGDGFWREGRVSARRKNMTGPPRISICKGLSFSQQRWQLAFLFYFFPVFSNRRWFLAGGVGERKAQEHDRTAAYLNTQGSVIFAATPRSPAPPAKNEKASLDRPKKPVILVVQNKGRMMLCL